MIYRTKDSWMQSLKYRQLRHKRFTMQGRLCQDCGQRGGLQLHHITYRFGGGEYPHNVQWGSEGINDVVGLCRTCHLERHKAPMGEFWADPEKKDARWGAMWKEEEKEKLSAAIDLIIATGLNGFPGCERIRRLSGLHGDK